MNTTKSQNKHETNAFLQLTAYGAPSIAVGGGTHIRADDRLSDPPPKCIQESFVVRDRNVRP